MAENLGGENVNSSQKETFAFGEGKRNAQEEEEDEEVRSMIMMLFFIYFYRRISSNASHSIVDVIL